MANQYIFTLAGPDQPGLITKLSKMTTDAGCKWSKAKLAHLQGRFICIFKLDVDSATANQMKQHYEALKGFQVTMAEAQAAPMPEINMKLRIDAADRSTIVRDITDQLGDLEVSIDHMDCHRVGTMDSGTMFMGQFDIHVPVDLTKESILDKLNELGFDMKVRLDPA